jgi:dihydrofolate synthase/folylpolyglutamate synthase
MKITSFDEARERLRQFYNASAEYKLDTMRAFMEFLGNPQDTLQVIHIAGTSGKTSTAYYAAGLLKAAGYTVGLTVSPHVDEINERVQINLEPLAEAEFCAALTEFLDLVQKSGLKLSYFEVMIAFAYWYFAKIKVDYAVVEVGLGGRIDGTNVITRPDKISVITSIGLDHIKILGSTLPEIAREKAGIILPDSDVFVNRQAPEIMHVFNDVCETQRAKLHVVEDETMAEQANLPLFQYQNLRLAAAAVQEALARKMQTLTEAQIAKAAQTYVPARMERMRYGTREVIVDGSHNGQKLHALLESVQSAYPGKSIAALVAFVGGDEARIREGLQELIKAADHLIITEFISEQDLPKHSVAAEVIAEKCEMYGFHAHEQIKDPVKGLAALADRPEDVLLVTGSFYLQSHVRPHMLKT